MRTTLTLMDDVAGQLEQVRSARKARFKDVINEALRVGLKQMVAPRRAKAAYRTASVSSGQCRVGSIDEVAETLALVEGENFR